MEKKKKFETLSIRTQLKKTIYKEHSVPMYLTSGYAFDSAESAKKIFSEEQEGYVYSRYNNPSTDEFIEKLCLLENAEKGIATASGMSAVFLGIAGQLSAGDHLLASKQLFGTTYLFITQILPKWGISHSFVDLNKPDEWEENILPITKMVYIETPSNPGLDIIDLSFVGKLCEKHDLFFLVDNSFASPYIQNPMQYGADYIIHSSTKFIDGQGRTIGGAIVGKKKYFKEIESLSRTIGPVMSPFEGWLLSKSLETLAVRMEKHCENAFKLAKFLEVHSDVLWVKYPFLTSFPNYKTAKTQMKLGGALICFEPKGGGKAAMKLLNELKIFTISANLGDSRSIVTHPSTTTHSKLSADERLEAGITEGLIRISVGLEHSDDIIEDMDQALKNCR